MSQIGYFSPAILGALAAVVYALFGRGSGSLADRGIIALVGVPAVALSAQLLMTSAQGVFAAVLPVPFGRTLRGRKCAVIGFLMIAAWALGAVAWLASRSGGSLLTIICAAAGGLCAMASLGMYGWSVPTATADFAEPA